MLNANKKKSILINFNTTDEEKLHTKLKVVAAQQKTTMTAIILELVRNYLKNK